MRFTVLTLFPELVRTCVTTSITGRALDRGLFEFEALDLHQWSQTRYGSVDDTLYGGGTGMLMQAEPLWQGWLAAGGEAGVPASDRRSRTIYLSPKGPVLNQAKVNELARDDKDLILICGHYEGIDERFLEASQAEELSIGDYVLTGGELAAAVLIDAVARQLPGVLPAEEAFTEESLYEGSLECRQYTRPAEWRGHSVPPVLLSGDHAKIARWRHIDGLRETCLKRPDLFDELDIPVEDLAELAEHLRTT